VRLAPNLFIAVVFVVLVLAAEEGIGDSFGFTEFMTAPHVLFFWLFGFVLAFVFFVL
jgi:hypothetical protein